MLTLFGILVSIGLSLEAINAHKGEIALYGLLPFGAGLACGDLCPRRMRWDPLVIVFAPFISTMAVAVVVGAASTYHAVVDPNATVSAPYIVQGLVGALFVIPGAFIYGAVPSIVGASIASILKVGNDSRVADKPLP